MYLEVKKMHLVEVPISIPSCLFEGTLCLVHQEYSRPRDYIVLENGFRPDQTVKTTANRPIAVRETDVSHYHGGLIEGFRSSQDYRIEWFKECP